MRTCYLAALSSLKNSPASRAVYERKRTEGESHKQARIALTRRRISTLWAMFAIAPSTRSRSRRHWLRPFEESIEIPSA
jgi:hypothetical protein